MGIVINPIYITFIVFVF